MNLKKSGSLEKQEMLENGYIQLHRQMLKWEWMSEPNTSHLFIYCLLVANYYDNQHKGTLVKRGSFLTSLRKLSKETGLSFQNVRTSLKRLKSTQEITYNTTQDGTTITICKYDTYQLNIDMANTEDNTQSNKQVTHDQHISNNSKNLNNNNYYARYELIIKHLNDKTGKKFRFASSIGIYKNLLAYKYTDEDFITVIDNMVKAWKGTNFPLQPFTLFKNATKFEMYLNWQFNDNNPENEETFEDDEQYL